MRSAGIPEGDPKPRSRPRKQWTSLPARPSGRRLWLCRSSPRLSWLRLGGAGPVAQGTGSRQALRPGVRPHLLRARRAEKPGGVCRGSLQVSLDAK